MLISNLPDVLEVNVNALEVNVNVNALEVNVNFKFT
jgi:hypothetical protein